MKKKFLSIAVCLCMIMTMIPGGVLQPDEAWAAEHTSHCVCGGSRAIGDHTEHTDITDWKEWTETTYLPNKAGSYYLTQNVEISEAWEPASGTVLCLNGKNITANGRFDAIDVQASVTFTLTDCEPNSTRGNITHAKDSNNAALSGSGVSVKAGAVFNMYGGNITGNEVTIGGSGVSVEAGADFNMHGGSITKNTALNNSAKGGGVNNYGIFTMTGGTISGNQGGTANGGGGGGVLNAGTFTMSGTAVIGGTNAEDANIGYNGGGVYNYNTGQFNFNGGTIIGNEANKNGGGVYNEQGSSTFTMTGGIIKKNKAKNGGGVAVNNSATFTMNGGTIGDENSDDGNTVTNEGGGVYVLSGIFNMDTGKIIGNTAVGSKTDEYRGWGGGVNNYGIFTMTGGTISSNSAIKEQGSAGALGAGGGIYNNRSGTFTMSGGNISNNTSDSHGGGVYNSGTFTMSDTAAISGNTVTNETCYGGGVFNYSSFTMNGGTIGGLNEGDANTAGFGGGLYHGDGEAQLNGGMIQGNIAAKSGGGVFYTKNITLKNVTITGNTANEDGGGAWMGFVDDAVMTVDGTTTITDNKDKDGKANNVGLRMGKSLTADASLSPFARIGITTLTSNEKTLVKNSTDTKVFTSDMSGYKLIDDGNSGLKLAIDDGSTPTQTGHKHYLCGKTHTEVGDHTSDEETKFTAWTRTDSLPDTAGNYYLTEDVTLTSAVEYRGGIGKDYCGWDVPDGVVLCLNGQNITMKNPDGMTDEVDVIKVSGHFTLTDCKTGDAQGKITHATDASSTKCEGKGVKVLGGTFDMFGGIISGNTTNYDIGGGGVSVEGVSDTTKASIFKLYGGKISGNTAKSGGGVHVRRTVWCGPSEFRMYGGSITNNNADSDAGSYGVGGGVYVSWTSKFVMSGGTISGNTATKNGGGLYASALAKEYASSSGGAATLNVSGNATIRDNTVDNKKNNVYLDSSTTDIDAVSATLTINNPLTGEIGVTAAEVPAIIATGADSDTNYSTVITSDNADYKVMHNSSNKSELMLVSTAAPEHHWSKEWSADDTYHWHECTDADCTKIKDRAEHSGGTATCTEKAVCSVCKAPYGEVSEHEFGGEYKYSAAGHWQECQREGCTATGSITDHIYDNSSDVICNICGYVRTVKPGTSGKTDNVINKAEDRNAGTAASTTATIKPSTTTSGEKKTTTATVDNTTANKILDKAVSNKSTEVIINTLTRAGISEAQAGTATEIALPEKTVRELSEKTEASLIIRSDAAEITLDKKSVDGLAAQAGTDGYVRLIVEIVKQDSNTLEAELKLITSKGTVTDFKGGNVSVMVKLNDTLAAKDLVCVYIDDSNIYHMVNGAKNSDGTYSFMTGHFSTYAVMARSEAEKVIAEQNADKATELVKSVKLKARSAKTAKGNIRVTLSVANGRDSIKALEDLGYTVKYKYYRSTSRAKNYKSMLEGTGKTYINTAGKKGTKYFYKARLTVYDAQGRLIAKTELKQCRYACRVK